MLRFFETIPGMLAWGTIAGLIGGAYFFPRTIGIFVVLFDVYWFLKSVYLAIHMRTAFSKMGENLKVDWRAELEKLGNDGNNNNNDNDSRRHSHGLSSVPHWRNVRHLVIFPMYREPYEVVRESFASLSKTTYPKEKIFVVLATEERADLPAGASAKAGEAARRIAQEFGGCFGKLLVTVHPSGLPGEIPGKGSNIAWAARRAKEELLDPLFRAKNENEHEDAHSHSPEWCYRNILVSAFDIDTQAPPDYFARLTHAFLTAKDPLRAIYQPIPLFTNNIYQAPLLARVVAFSATFWQMMQQARPERLTTFSSQSVPLPVLEDVGFWDRSVVSEDSRIFWQAYLRYGGDFRVEPLHFPVMMDANVAPTFWGTMRNVYLQQRRWGWGVENVPYVLSGFFQSKAIRLPNIRQSDCLNIVPREKKLYWTFNMLEGFHSWATNVLIIFFLGWLPTLIGGAEFRTTLLSYSIPSVTRILMFVAMISVVTAATLSVSLLPPRPVWFRRRHMTLFLLEWWCMPFTLILFGAIPALEAQTRLMLGGKYRLGFWVTPKTRDMGYGMLNME
ncbi:MAG: glycosyltransferase family 2 protein [Candidatus Liptonbacteria bacterium]|nr:glycosyltransferase family 2 protein [Candidatus Liptonbacteria bacterium]